MWHIYANINFNSRTHVECDKRRCGAMCRQDHFNSRTHVECDRRFANKQTGERDFNSRTHVECDCECIQFQFWNNSFQLTHSRGVRPSSPLMAPCSRSFQLTHSRGVRPTQATADKYSDAYFNSRTHVECDRERIQREKYMMISTHALTWSATAGVKVNIDVFDISTHALTWSATCSM